MLSLSFSSDVLSFKGSPLAWPSAFAILSFGNGAKGEGVRHWLYELIDEGSAAFAFGLGFATFFVWLILWLCT